MFRSVRDRDSSPDDPNRLVMSTVADSPKKRKRALSPLPHRRTPNHSTEHKITDMESEKAAARASFDAALGYANEINAYTQAHAEIVKLEEEDAWDREAKPKPTSRSKDVQTEKRAAAIIWALREYERRVTFGNLASEAIPGPETRDMGGQFLTNKDRIDGESKLYEIAKMVPKGGLLHLHFNAELHPERLLEQARDMPNMYIRSIRPLLHQKDLDLTETVFNVMDPEMVEPGVNIFSENYPGTATNWRQDDWKWRVWMPWSDFRREFDLRFGMKYKQEEDTILYETPKTCSEPGTASLLPAENWLKSKMVLSQEEAYGFTQTVNG